MPSIPAPFNTSIEQFSLVVDILAQLLSEGKVRLKSSPGSNISFVVKSNILDESIQKIKVNKDTMARVINEVSLISTLILKEVLSLDSVYEDKW